MLPAMTPLPSLVTSTDVSKATVTVHHQMNNHLKGIEGSTSEFTVYTACALLHDIAAQAAEALASLSHVDATRILG
jgi:hypothetical protein